MIRREMPLTVTQKETEICLDLSPTMYDAVKASGYRIGYQRPAPLVKRTQTTLLMTAQPTASVLSTTTNLDDIPHDATSSEGFPTSDDAFPPPWVTWYMNAASTSEVDPDPVAAQWNAILQACVEPCFRMDDISTQQSGNAESLECSENAPVKNTVEASGSGTHDIPFPIASASPAPDFTHQRSAERATGSGHASSANSAHSTPGGSGHKRSWSLHEWEDDSDEDIDDIVARMEGIWLGTDEDAIVSNVLEEVSSRLQAMVTQLNSTLSETSLRGFLDDTLLSLRTFLDEVNLPSSATASTTDQPGKRMAQPSFRVWSIPHVSFGGSPGYAKGDVGQFDVGVLTGWRGRKYRHR